MQMTDTRAVTHPPADGLTPALAGNTDAVMNRRRENHRAASAQERAVAAISKFAGSMVFVLAIKSIGRGNLLFHFVLINQNRMAAEDDIRADLDLLVSLLTEHETTRLIAMVEVIAKKLDVSLEAREEFHKLKQDVAPEAVLDRLEEGSPRRLEGGGCGELSTM